MRISAVDLCAGTVSLEKFVTGLLLRILLGLVGLKTHILLFLSAGRRRRCLTLACTIVIVRRSRSGRRTLFRGLGWNGFPGISLIEVVLPFLSIPCTILSAQLALKELPQVIIRPIFIVRALLQPFIVDVVHKV